MLVRVIWNSPFFLLNYNNKNYTDLTHSYFLCYLIHSIITILKYSGDGIHIRRIVIQIHLIT